MTSYLVPMMTTAIGISAIIMATGFRRGDLISPFSTCLILLTAIYGVRPLFMLANDQFWFYGLAISREGFDQAALIGLLGVTAMCLGYLGNRKMSRPLPLRPQVTDPGGFGLTVIAALAVLAAWFVVTAFIGGGAGFVADTFDGRGSGTTDAAYTGVPAVASALPVVAGLLVAVRRIIIERTRRFRFHENVLYWLVVGLAIIPPLALGGRRFLIPTVIAALTGVCVRNWRRPVGVGMGVLSLVIAFALMIIPYVRSAGSRVGENKDLLGAMGDHLGTAGIGGVLSDFFLSYDTEMFSYVAYVSPLIEGGMMPLGYGRGTAVEMGLAILPSSLLPSRTWSNTMLDTIFGRTCAEGVCPVPSVFGTLYFDLWFPGLVLGSILIGWLCAGYGQRLVQAQGYRLAVIVLLGSFAPLMARGNMMSQLWIAIQVFVVLVVAMSAVTVVGRAVLSVRPPPQVTRLKVQRNEQNAPTVAAQSAAQHG